MGNVKKRALSLILCVALCFSLCTPALAANTQGVTYNASFNVEKLTVSSVDQEVVLTVNMNKAMAYCSLDYDIVCPDGVTVKTYGHESITFSAVQAANNTVSWNSADAEDITSDNIGIITFTIPANTPAGDYTFEIKNISLSDSLGFNVWETGATVQATLKIEEGTGTDPNPDVPVVGENDPQFVVSDVYGKAGDEIDVTVSMLNNPGVVNVTLNIAYDTEKLQLLNVVEGSVMSKGTFSQHFTANPYYMNWDESTAEGNNTNSGVMATLTFKILETAGTGSTDIKVSYPDGEVYDFDINDVSFATVDGSVIIVDWIPGDINGDGVVSSKDRTSLKRHLAKWDGYGVDDINALAADVNHSGDLSSKDATYLSRYLAKWDGYVLSYPQITKTNASTVGAKVDSAVYSYSSDTLTFTAASVNAKSGEEIEVPISISNNPGINW